MTALFVRHSTSATVGRPDCVVSGGLNISLNTAVIYKFPHWIYIHLLFKCERNCYTLRLFEIVYWHSRGNFEKQFRLLQNNLCLRCLIKGSMKYETYIYTVKWSSDCEVPYSDVALSSLHLLWISVIELLTSSLYNLTACCSTYNNPEDGSNKVFRNIGTYLTKLHGVTSRKTLQLFYHNHTNSPNLIGNLPGTVVRRVYVQWRVL